MPKDVLDEVWREHWARLLGQLLARFGRPDLVEDVLAAAFAEGVARWPSVGVPANPPGWVRTVAQRRVIDALRREGTLTAKAHLLADDDVPGPESALTESWAAAGGAAVADADERLPLLLMARRAELGPSGAWDGLGPGSGAGGGGQAAAQRDGAR